MNTYKVGLILGLSVISLVGCAGGKKVTANTPGPVTAKTIDPNLPPEEKKIQLLAQQIELEQQLKKTRQERDKLRTPAEKRAVKIVRHEEKKEVESEQKKVETLQYADILKCRSAQAVYQFPANTSDTDTVFVKVGATGSEKSNRPWAKMIIKNSSSGPVDIQQSGKGTQVKNLGPGCSVTLRYTLSFVWDPMYISYHYTAQGTIAGDLLGTVDSPSVSLSEQNSEYRNDPQTWVIQLQKYIPQK